MIRLGGLMIFPDAYGADKPDGPDVVSCPVCGEDCFEGETCIHCGDPAPEDDR